MTPTATLLNVSTTPTSQERRDGATGGQGGGAHCACGLRVRDDQAEAREEDPNTSTVGGTDARRRSGEAGEGASDAHE